MSVTENTSESAGDLFLKYNFVVDDGQEPLRIDRYLVNFIQNASRNKLKEAIDKGQVTVNNKAVRASYKVKPADVIDVLVEKEPTELEIIPQDIPLDIVHEDDQILVVNKPAGMVVHPGFGNYDGTLLNALAFHFGASEMKMSEKRPWLVHRIDKDTSVLLVVAKTDEAMTFLAKQFKDHSIERTYNALVWGSLAESEGTISSYISRDKYDRKKYVVNQDEEGKWAVTHYKLLEDFMYCSLVQCNLETGRTHQIRVHLKHIGHTLFNDSFYGGDKILKGVVFSKYKQFIENCFNTLPRQALHAKSLGFIHPGTKEFVQFNSDLPTDISTVIEKWRKVNSTYGF